MVFSHLQQRHGNDGKAAVVNVCAWKQGVYVRTPLVDVNRFMNNNETTRVVAIILLIKTTVTRKKRQNGKKTSCMYFLLFSQL